MPEGNLAGSRGRAQRGTYLNDEARHAIVRPKPSGGNFFERALKSAGRAATSVLDQVDDDVRMADRVAKRILMHPVNNARKQWREGHRKPTSLRDAPHLEDTISPGGITGLLRAGGAALTREIDIAGSGFGGPTFGLKSLKKGATPRRGDAYALSVEGPGGGVSGRIPWIVDKENDVTYVARSEAEHRDIMEGLFKRGVAERPAPGFDSQWYQNPRWLQGWMYTSRGGSAGNIATGHSLGGGGAVDKTQLESLRKALTYLSRNLKVNDEDLKVYGSH